MDGQLWESPALLIAAQAFLLSVALNPDTPRFARLVVLALGLVPLFAAWHTMAKKRYLETIYSEAIARCLRALGLPEIRRGEEAYPDTILRHVEPRRRGWWQQPRSCLYRRLIVDRLSHRLWMVVFGTFFAADIVLLMYFAC